jgi:hypothetical protein
MYNSGSLWCRSIKTKVWGLKVGILRISANFISANFQYFFILKISVTPAGLKWGGTEIFRMKKYWKLAEIKFTEVLRRPRRVLTGKRHIEWGADVNNTSNHNRLLWRSSEVGCMSNPHSKLLSVEYLNIQLMSWIFNSSVLCTGFNMSL